MALDGSEIFLKAKGPVWRDFMKVLKWLGIVTAVYVSFVVVFEAVFLGTYQPTLESTGIPMLVITTTDDSGKSAERRLARFETDGKLYVSAHHWTRGWYRRALKNPDVRVEIDGIVSDCIAVPVEGEEFERVAAEYPLPLLVRFLMGFPPPRDILRLDPIMPGRLTDVGTGLRGTATGLGPAVRVSSSRILRCHLT